MLDNDPSTNAITIIILTFNEELNIRQAINSVLNWANEIIILDSGSTDRTCRHSCRIGSKNISKKI